MGMINYDTILSAYDDKLTLMQWLKKVEKALNEAAATSFKVNKKGNATISFSITFEDGSELESGDIVLQQGESVAAARIENGHLILTLTNGDDLDAGNLFNGNVNIVGDVSITGDLSAKNITGDSIIENMSGYSFLSGNVNPDFTPIYVNAVKNGNKLTCVWFISITPTATSYSGATLGDLNFPSSVLSKLYPFSLSGIDNLLDVKVVPLYSGYAQKVEGNLILQKYAGSILPRLYINNLVVGTTYLLRYEVTFLLSNNLAA